MLGYTKQALHKKQQKARQNLIEADLVLSEVKQIRKEQMRLGTRKVYSLIKPSLDKHNIKLGRDGFFDLLREFGMLVKPLRRKHYSTNSHHHFYKHPNLVKGYSPSAPNQLWVSDITYIEVNGKFMYLFLITDAYSRKIVGWHLSKNYSTQGALEALKMALEENKKIKGLIHHSDRGIQYCCKEYVALLKRNKIKISMTENSDPYENAIAERVNGILKTEYLKKRYEDHLSVSKDVGKAIFLYNNKRPHLSIEMKVPAYVHQYAVQVKNLWKKKDEQKKESMIPSFIKIQKETTITKSNLLFPLVFFLIPKIVIFHITNFYRQPISGQDNSFSTRVRRNRRRHKNLKLGS